MPVSFPNKPGLVIYLTAGDPDLATTPLAIPSQTAR